MSKKLKIATWNCRGAYRKKQNRFLSKFDPDIWVVQECEHPEKLKKFKGFQSPFNCVWYGENTNKGVAVFSKEGLELEIAIEHEPAYRHIIPINVSGDIEIKLYAVWAMNAKGEDRSQRYIGQIYSAFDHYEICEESTLIMGDFNWNKSFDKNSYGLVGKFDDYLIQMRLANLKSVYHAINSESFGQESKPTLHLQGKKEKTYHVDYIFASSKLVKKAIDLKIGSWVEWRKWSDHMPVYSVFKL